MPVTVKHFPWESMFRNGEDVIDGKQEKNVILVRHEAWHEWINSHLHPETRGKKHPKEIFLEMISYIQGVKECTEEESVLLYKIIGFNWRKKRPEAIISIFNQFMPDELYELVKPFYEAFEIEQVRHAGF